MLIIGCDYHPGLQQIAFVDTGSGDFQDRRLRHREEAENFYRDLADQGIRVRVGMEASGHARWFERLLAELNIELWVGDAAKIRAKRVRKKKTDREDARHILQLMLKDDFPKIWVPSWDNRDLRQLLWHRHRMVRMRTRIMNQLQAVALNEGLRCKKRLWRKHGRPQLESIRLAPWASRRRRDLLELLDRLNPTIAELTQLIEQEVEKYLVAQRLMTHPGVGALTALAFVLIIGEAERFGCGKLGLVPEEDSSGESRRLGHISKQGRWVDAFLSSGSSAGDSTERCRVAQQICSISPCDEDARLPRSRWLADWRFVCTGCGARDGTIRSSQNSIRTRASSQQALVCSRTPSNRLSSPLPFAGEFELAIVIELVDRRDAWVGLSF